jgi:hypothetical protein
VEDLGQPSSYLALERGVQVYSSDGRELGHVVEVLAVRGLDVFDGLVFDATPTHGGHRFVDGPEVLEVYERGVVLRIDAAEAARLPPPSPNPAAMSVSGADLAADSGGSLRRAWGRLFGRR